MHKLYFRIIHFPQKYSADVWQQHCGQHQTVGTGKKTHLEQDKSNVLQWYTEDGTRVCVRPSGTEPKIKFYFGVKATLPSVADYEKVRAELNDKIERIKKELKLV